MVRYGRIASRVQSAASALAGSRRRDGVEPCSAARRRTDAAVDRGQQLRGRPVARRLADGSKIQLYRLQDGVALIDVQGNLVNRGAFIGPAGGFQSYEGLAEQLRAALADPNVRGILLDLESPGGEAAGAISSARLCAMRPRKSPSSHS